MVRTRADGIKATGAKAPRKVAVSSPRGSSTKGKERGSGSGGGNAYNSQPVPSWQRPVASFFTAVPRATGDASGSSAATAGGSSEATPGGSSEATAGGSAEATPGGSSEATAGGSAEPTAGGSSEPTAGGSSEATAGGSSSADPSADRSSSLPPQEVMEMGEEAAGTSTENFSSNGLISDEDE